VTGPRVVIGTVGQFTIETDTPDEVIAWLELGEAGSPWWEYGKTLPMYVLGSVRAVQPDPGVSTKRGE
jgi:hypothetical protein